MTNSKTYQDYWFVAKGDQAFPTGNIISNKIEDGQLGVIVAEPTTDPATFGNVGDFIAAANLPANTPAIKIVQGTPASQDYSNNAGWFNEHKAYVASPIIRNGELKSFSARYAPVQAYSAQLVTGFDDAVATPVADHEYSVYTTLDSIRKDRDYGRNQHRVPPAYFKFTAAPTGATSANDYLLANLAHKYNRFSKLITNKPRHSTHEVVCLAISSAGGSGTALSTLNIGTPVDFMTLNGVTYSIPVNEALVQTMFNVVSNSAAITSASTIEVIDIDSVGAGAGFGTIDSLLFVGLDEDLSVGTDLIYDSKANIRALELGRDFLTDFNVSNTAVSTKQNALNSARVLKIRWEESGSTLQGTMQLAGFSDTLILPPNYIEDGTEYTVYTLTTERKIDTLTIEPNFKFRINILIPATKTTAGDAATGVPATTASTTAATTIAGLETNFKPWLLAANPHKLLGEATTTAYFV